MGTSYRELLILVFLLCMLGDMFRCVCVCVCVARRHRWVFLLLGDIFSCHAVDNPHVDGEIEMLRRYGPDVPMETLRRLVSAFSELRDMADQGLINYPYSTREVVNMVKHLQVGCLINYPYSTREVVNMVKHLQVGGMPASLPSVCMCSVDNCIFDRLPR